MNELEKTEEAPWDMEWVSTGRLQNLTDGVFAIAMTLLLFNLTVPLNLSWQSIEELFLNLWPEFLTYFLSFMALSTFWVGHHNHFHFIERSNRKFLWINIFFLSFVVLVPFSTAILRNFYDNTIAVLVYGGNLLICGIGMYWYWSYASTDHLLINPETSEKKIQIMKDRVLVPIVLAIAVMAIAFVSPLTSLFLFLVLFILATIPTNTDHLFSLFSNFLHADLKIKR